MAVGNMIFMLDLSLSLSGQPMGVLYNCMMEMMDSLERHDDLLYDALIMGTGDDGEGCQWLCDGMSPISELRDRVVEFRGMGHTPLLKAMEDVSGRVASLADTDGTAIVLITDGQAGFTTADEVGDAVSGCLRDCHRMVVLVGFNHDEDVMEAFASSEDMVFNDPDSAMGRINELMDGWI